VSGELAATEIPGTARAARGRAQRSTSDPRRLVVGVALAALGATALSLDAVRVEQVVVQAPAEAVVLPPSGASSTAWYCPGGLPGDAEARVAALAGAQPDETTTTVPEDVGAQPSSGIVFVTNLAGRDTTVRMSVLAAGAPVASERLEIAGGASVAVHVADYSDAPDAAVMVESFADGIVVEQGIDASDRDDFEVVTCATQASATWYFAAGSTLRGSTQWLAILNPFSGDAAVDIQLLTSDGVRRPSALQSVSIAARSRTVVLVNEHADRKTVVGVIVRTRDGRRVVAQQTIVHENVERRSGVSTSLGATRPSTRATFVTGIREGTSQRLLFIMNPQQVPTDVDIQLVAEGTTPQTISVPAESVATVNVNRLVPAGQQYALIVQSAADFSNGAASTDRGVVVEDFEQYRLSEPRGAAFVGITGGGGMVAPARAWHFGRNRLNGDHRGFVVLYNPNERDVTVVIRIVRNGTLVTPDELAGIVVEGASRRSLRLDQLVDENSGIVVSADLPVYAARLLLRAEVASRAAGIPDRSD
jgi:hypothetical protein